MQQDNQKQRKHAAGNGISLALTQKVRGNKNGGISNETPRPLGTDGMGGDDVQNGIKGIRSLVL